MYSALRYRIQVIPEQAWFDVQKLVLAAILGFILGTGGNFILYYAINRDRRLRRLESESKRYKFWKEFLRAAKRCEIQRCECLKSIKPESCWSGAALKEL
jgi:hypothetical protein